MPYINYFYSMKYSACFLFLLFSFVYSFAQQKAIVGNEVNPFLYTITKSKVYSKAAVVCAHPLASEIGAAVIKKGGNAFDAAIAVNFALAVVYPGAGNIGGGGFFIARKKKGQLIAFDFPGKGPAQTKRNM